MATKRRWLILLALLALPALLKVVLAAGTNDFGPDGSYYFDVARHIRDGEGISSNNSAYHHGYQYFPHPAPIYPIWPLTLGFAGRVVPIETAAVWIPTLLYFVATAFAFLWASRLPRWPLVPSWKDGPDTAHAAALLFALSVPFFAFTSRPYTEALGYAVLFATLWRANHLWRKPGLLSGLELGFWIGLVFLTRSQLVLVGMAAACTFGWALAVGPDRKRIALMAIACAAAAVAVVLPQYLRLAESTVRPMTALLRFEMAQANDLLPAVHVLRKTHGAFGAVLDRLPGLWVAFSPVHKMSYMQAFFGLQYALLLAVPLALRDGWSAFRRNRPGALAWARDPDKIAIVFLLFFAAGGFASLHLIRKDVNAEWHFGKRHALTAFFAFQLGWLYLAGSARPLLRRIALALMVVSLAGGLSQAVRITARAARGTDNYPDKLALVAFLDQQRPADGSSLTVASSTAGTQRLAVQTAGRVNYHWLHKHTTLADLDVLFQKLGVTLLLVNRASPPLDFLLPEKDFDAKYRLVVEIDGYGVYEPRSE